MITRVEARLTEREVDLSFRTGFLTGLDGAPRAAWARDAWADLREQAGYAREARPILTSGAAQHKLGMSDIATVGLMLTPERGIMRSEFADLRSAYGLDGAWNLCPWATKGCAAACLTFSGQSGMPAAQYAQGVRTVALLAIPEAFFYLIGYEIGALAKRKGKVAVRLNTTSDIQWERVLPKAMDLAREHNVVFYDYTKAPVATRPEVPGYDLTRSASERDSEADIKELVNAGERVAVPFFLGAGQPFPAFWQGMPVIDGDQSDFRPDDRKGVVLALRVKGHKGARDASGFIRNL